MQWHTQAGNIATNIKVEIDFTITELSATNVVTWNIHVGDSAKGRYDMILRRDRLKELGLHLNYFDQIVKAGGLPFKESTAPIVDLGIHKFKFI